jgi:hypothetical protein
MLYSGGFGLRQCPKNDVSVDGPAGHRIDDLANGEHILTWLCHHFAMLLMLDNKPDKWRWRLVGFVTKNCFS